MASGGSAVRAERQHPVAARAALLLPGVDENYYIIYI
jgi:hypothetical protein